ncbi:MAG: Doxorubicin resistance ATP-binding protein DrrA [Candidatus Dependentiae bacterium ADurb.Bin331]|nr:MAG: Doxorubicin resistance ATP-binding protein DrrA [Candidatus Dependentiae bacterium ADurb.Bin331]
MQKVLQLFHVNKKYIIDRKEVYALNDVSLDLFEGEIMTLLGVNGAGKTTLSSIIATLKPASSGDVLYKGKSIYENLVQFRRVLGFCPQKPNFERRLTVEENLIFSGRYFGIESTMLKNRVKQLLEEFELTPYAHSLPDILSGGYKQRLLIARALVHQPKILILDEPTVALDPQVRRNLWHLIASLKNRGMTIILTTHYLDEAEVLSDRVCVLDKGKIVLVDTPHNLKQLYQKANLEEVFIHLIDQQREGIE